MFKKMIFLFSVMVFMLSLSFCNSPVGPEDPIEPVVKYDLELTYIRVGNINLSRISGNPSIYLFYVNTNVSTLITRISHLTRINNYKFEGEFDQIYSNSGNSIYALQMSDWARGDGLSSDSFIVGKKLIIKVKQTGFEKELRDIRKNHFSFNPQPGEKGRIACFVLTKEGTIISEPWGSYQEEL